MAKKTYLAEVIRDATARVAGIRTFDSGTEAIEILFELAEPLPSGEKDITGYLWLSDKAIENTRKTLKAIGVDPDDSAYENENQLADAVAGKKFKLVCGLEAPGEYNKRERWQVKYVNAPSKPPSGSVLARLRGQQGTLPLVRDDDPDSTPF